MPRFFSSLSKTRSRNASNHDLVHITLPKDSPFYILRGDGGDGRHLRAPQQQGSAKSLTGIGGSATSLPAAIGAQRSFFFSGEVEDDTAKVRFPRSTANQYKKQGCIINEFFR
jgi:hypothetical protein